MTEQQDGTVYWKTAMFLIVLVSMVYSSAIFSEWQLDDHYFLKDNSAVQMTSLDPESLKNSFFAAPGTNSLTRPVVYFSFAINWFLWQDDPAGYRIFNIGIHILVAFFLFLTILLLFQSPNLNGWDKNDAYFIALLSAVLWAIHPIQIQGVTYIVQRFASMAALFYIMGIYCYFKARLTGITFHKAIFFILCAVTFLLGIASKENAVMLPVIIIIMEFVFFRDLSQKTVQKQAGGVIATIAILLVIGGGVVFLDGKMNSILAGYEMRFFSLHERVLTQSRIVLFYLSQVFLPLPWRFSVEHDVTLSTSLFSPWTTFPSILLIFSAISMAAWRLRKNPVPGFAVLFFFGNHIIESSIMPLELVFEHRNYLPTLFLFVPVAMSVKMALDYFRQKNAAAYTATVLAVCMVLVGVGQSTFARNTVWRTEKSLWEDAMIKAPNSARPFGMIAGRHYHKTGEVEKEIQYYYRAMTLVHHRTDQMGIIYGNLAAIYFNDIKNYEKSAQYAQKAIELNPKLDPKRDASHMYLSYSLARLGRFDDAMAGLDRLLTATPHNKEALYLKGFLLLKRGKPSEALTYLKKCLDQPNETPECLRAIGLCFNQMKHYERGYWFLRRAYEKNPEDAGTILCIADNRARTQSPDVNEWIERLMETVGYDNVAGVLFYLKYGDDPMQLPVDPEKIAPVIAEKLLEKARKHHHSSVRISSVF